MSILTRITALFRRYPQYDVSGYRSIYTAVVNALQREGVTIGRTAFVPRVEVHSIREQSRLDKEGALREINMTIESISNRSLGDAVTMNEDNLRLLTGGELNVGTDWQCAGVVPVLLQDLTESSDTNKILYRILQEVTIFLEEVKSDTPPPTPEPETNTDNDN